MPKSISFKFSSLLYCCCSLYFYINGSIYMFLSESHVADLDGGEKADREADGKVSRTYMGLVFNS